MKKIFYIALATFLLGFSACRHKHNVDLETLQQTTTGIDCYAYHSGSGYLLITGQMVNGEQEGAMKLPIVYSVMITAEKKIRLSYATKLDDEESDITIAISQSSILTDELSLGTARTTEKMSTPQGITTEITNCMAVLLSDEVGLVLQNDSTTEDFFYLIKDWREAIEKSNKEQPHKQIPVPTKDPSSVQI